MIGIEHYKLPAHTSSEIDKLGWLLNALGTGENFLETQSAYKQIDYNLGIMMGSAPEKMPKALSDVRVPRAKRQIREIVSSLSNLRPMWGYKADNRALEEQAEILNKLVLAWWYNTFVDRKLRKVLQYAAALGTGYAHVYWKPDMCNGQGDIEIDALGPRDFVPINMSADFDLENAYGGIIKTELSINRAWALWPTYQDKIVPDRTTPTVTKSFGSRLGSLINPVIDRLSGSRAKEVRQSTFPTVDIFYAYVRDTSLNMTDDVIQMGSPKTSWAYDVPPLATSADPKDARLYPSLRLLIFTRSCLLYDGPSFWWHGDIPVVKFTVDDWPWEYLGQGLLTDVDSIERSNNRLFRVIDDSANARMRPPMKYDGNLVSEAQVRRLDLRQGGQSIGVNMTLGNPIEPLFDPKQYDVPNWIIEHIKMMEDRADYVTGVQDFVNFAKQRNQTPSDSTIEKMEEMAGPIITDMSRNMERSLRSIGELVKSLIFQFYTAPRRVAIMGADGLTDEDYDFEPQALVPSHMPDEQTDTPSKYSRLFRAKKHQNNFYFRITPGTAHEITQMSRKMFYLQLSRSGFPLDPWTQAEVYNIPNFGNAPEGTQDVFSRWLEFMKIQNKLQIELETEKIKAQLALQMDPNVMLLQQAMQAAQGGAPEGAPAEGGAPGSDGTGQGNPGRGRKPTGQEPPHMETKDGGTRTTISET